MKRMKKNRKKLLALALVLGMLAAGLAGCGNKETDKAELEAETDSRTVAELLEEEQGTPLATLGEETIFLEEAVFYTRMLQESWEYMYYEYYGEELWQEEINAEVGTLADALKRDVMDALTEIHLLCAHAEEFGVELTAEEMQVIADRAKAFLESNTPEVLELAGADLEMVERFLLRNELAAKVAETAQANYEPEIDEEAARVGRLTYALFATTGRFDAEGNRTPYTEEELEQVRIRAEAFEGLAQELQDISAAGEEASHTVIDVYFNEETDGGAHELVAAAARKLEVGEVSHMIETEEGYYIVQRVSEYDEEATLENIELQKEQARMNYSSELLGSWLLETPLEVDEVLWDTVEVKELLTDPAMLK